MAAPPPAQSSPALPGLLADDAEPGRFARFTRAMRHRNYRLFFGGQLISLVGTFLTQAAMIWLVYRLTLQPWLMGIVGFASQIPMLLLAPFAGVWVDRWNLRRLLVVTQILAMLQSFGLAAVAYHFSSASGGFIPCMVGLGLLQGMINAFDMPGRQAFLVEMVEDRADLANAIALNSTMVHAARVVGPTAAGFLIRYAGETSCFLLDGVSYIAVIAALLMMRLRPRTPRAVHSSVLQQLKDGYRYVVEFAPIRVMLQLIVVVSLAGLPVFSLLMPVFSAALSHGSSRGGAQTLGLLLGSSGLGALVGAVYLASRRSVVGLGSIIAAASALFGFSMIAFAYSQSLWLSMLIAAASGFGMLMNFASANTLLQTLVRDDMRGRVMSFFTMAFIGVAPFGNLIGGALASHLGPDVIGPRRTLTIGGVVCIVAAIVFSFRLPMLRALVRPIYIEKGILPPELAAGLNSTADLVATGES